MRKIWTTGERIGYGLVLYLPTMMGAAAFLFYFGILPEDDANGAQTAWAFWGLPVWLVLVALFGAPIMRAGVSLFPLAFGGWGVASSWERFLELRSSPDLNGDGVFSISDVPAGLASIFLEVGRRYIDVFADTKIGPFLEMNTDPYSIFWSVVFTLFVYFMAIYGVIMIWNYEAPLDDDD